MNHVRCFDHVIALSAKSVLSPFDGSDDVRSSSTLENTEEMYRELEDDLEEEEEPVNDEEQHAPLHDTDDVDGWVDEVAMLSEEDQDELRETVAPVQRVLFKVCLITLFGRQNTHAHVLPVCSCASFRSPSSTPPLFYSPTGAKLLPDMLSQTGSCLATSKHAGTRHLSCLTLPWSIGKRWTRLLATAT